MSTSDGNPDSPAAPTGKLESLSKEDLIKFVKKQMFVLQKTKLKCEELIKENAELTKSSSTVTVSGLVTAGDSSSSVGKLREDLATVSEERDQLRLQCEAVRAEKELLASRIATLTDEVDAVKHQQVTSLEQITNLETACTAAHVNIQDLSLQLQEEVQSKGAFSHSAMSLQQRCAQLERELEESRIFLADRCAVLETECETLRHTIDDLNKKIEDTDAVAEHRKNEYQNCLCQKEKMEQLLLESEEEKLLLKQKICFYEREAVLDKESRERVTQERERVTQEREAELKEAPTLDRTNAEKDSIHLLEDQDQTNIGDRLKTLEIENQQLLLELSNSKQEVDESKRRAEEIILGVGLESAERLAQYKEELADLRSSKEDADSAIQNLLAKVNELSSTINLHEEEKLSLQALARSQLEVLQCEKDALMEQLQQSLTLNVDLQNDKANLLLNLSGIEAANNQLREQLDGTSSQNKVCSDEKNDLTNRLSAACNQKDELVKTVQEMTVQRDALQSEIAQLNSDCSAFREREAALHQELSHVVAKVKAMEEHHQQELMRVSLSNANNEATAAEIIDLRDRLADSQRAVEEANQVINSLQEAIEKQAEENAAYVACIEQDVEKLRNSIANKEASVGNLEKQLHAQLRSTDGILRNLLQEAQNNVNEQLAHFHAERDAMQEQTDQLMSRIEALTHEKIGIMKDLAALRSRVTQLAPDLTEVTPPATIEMTLQVHHLSAMIEAFIRQRDASVICLQNSLEEMANQLKSSEEKCYTLQVASSQSAVKDSEIDRMKGFNEESNVKLAEERETSRRLSEEKETLVHCVRDMEDKLSRLMDEVSHSQQQHSEREKDMCSLQVENAALRSELSQVINTLHNSQKEVVADREAHEEPIAIENAAISNSQSQVADRDRCLDAQVLPELASGTSALSTMKSRLAEVDSAFDSSKQTLDISEQDHIIPQKESALEVGIAQRDVTMRDVFETKSNAAVSEPSGESAKIKELEEKCSKFKLLTLKAKKDLAESKKTVELLKAELQSKSATETQTLFQNYQLLQNNVDRLHDDLDAERLKVASLNEQVELEKNAVKQLQEQYARAKEDLEEIRAANNGLTVKLKTYETQQSENRIRTSALEKEVESKLTGITQLQRDAAKLTEQMKAQENSHNMTEERLKAKITELESKVQEARDELEHAHKKASKNNLMDLEIADFERTVQNLQDDIKSKAEEITSLQQELEYRSRKCSTLEAELADTKEQSVFDADKMEKLKTTIAGLTSQLTDAQQQADERQSLNAAVRAEQEVMKQQIEQQKIMLAQLASEKQTFHERLVQAQEVHQRYIRSAEVKNRTLESDLERSRSEMTALQQEYDGYKVRVHAVLKQQQTKGAVQAALENEKVEKEHVVGLLAQVKAKLQESNERLEMTMAESGLIQEELDKLSLKYNKTVSEWSSKELTWRQRVDQLMQENATIAADHAAATQRIHQQHELLTATLKDQIKVMQTEHQLTTNSLTAQISRLDAEKASMQVELLAAQRQLDAKPALGKQDSKLLRSDRVYSPSDVRHLEREAAEGMEQPVAVGHLQATPLVTTAAGLEHLLQDDNDDALSIRSLSSTQLDVDDEKYKAKLLLAERQQDHLRKLLNESEASCSRYNEQVTILKAEIRRLESNQQRESSISNMEYLKNVVFKFVSLPRGEERVQLIPVLHTMLKFSPEELASVRQMSQGEGPAAVEGQQQASGWSGYLHRWTGFSS